MTCEYSLDAKALCPVDGKPDVYRVFVRASRTIPVEEILSAVAKYAGEKVFQETLTAALHRDLAAEVETVGYHSAVRTVVVCGGAA